MTATIIWLLTYVATVAAFATFLENSLTPDAKAKFSSALRAKPSEILDGIYGFQRALISAIFPTGQGARAFLRRSFIVSFFAWVLYLLTEEILRIRDSSSTATTAQILSIFEFSWLSIVIFLSWVFLNLMADAFIFYHITIFYSAIRFKKNALDAIILMTHSTLGALFFFLAPIMIFLFVSSLYIFNQDDIKFEITYQATPISVMEMFQDETCRHCADTVEDAMSARNISSIRFTGEIRIGDAVRGSIFALEQASGCFSFESISEELREKFIIPGFEIVVDAFELSEGDVREFCLEGETPPMTALRIVGRAAPQTPQKGQTSLWDLSWLNAGTIYTKTVMQAVFWPNSFSPYAVLEQSIRQSTATFLSNHTDESGLVPELVRESSRYLHFATLRDDSGASLPAAPFFYSSFFVTVLIVLTPLAVLIGRVAISFSIKTITSTKLFDKNSFSLNLAIAITLIYGLFALTSA